MFFPIVGKLNRRSIAQGQHERFLGSDKFDTDSIYQKSMRLRLIVIIH